MSYKTSTNWFQREKLKGEPSKEKLEERLNYLIRKRDKIKTITDRQPWQYNYEPVSLEGLDREIEKIKQQLYSFV